MRQRTPKWKAELWSYLSRSDGKYCPVYQSCKLRLRGVLCPSEQHKYRDAVHDFVDKEDLPFGDPASIKLEVSPCPEQGRIFKLVRRLAYRRLVKAEIDFPPIPVNVITKAYDNKPIEIRKVPLKAHHGAAWQLNDCWLVHINSNDTSARQRFTLYHEIFHILVRSKVTPVFYKRRTPSDKFFSEVLADYFARVMLLPEKLVSKKWAEVKDIGQMAIIFDVPKTIMWLALKHSPLI